MLNRELSIADDNIRGYVVYCCADAVYYAFRILFQKREEEVTTCRCDT